MAPLVFLVSAASSGFGKNIALEALRRGHKVVATARTSSKLADLEKEGAVTMDLDVTQPLEELNAIVGNAHKVYGRIDILINAAGYILSGSIEESSPQETFNNFNTNVFGVLNLSRAVLPYMRTQKSGVIAQFGSVGSWQGVPAAGIYCATKWAVSCLSEALRAEVSSFGIDVCCIEPGYFRTGFLNSTANVSSKTQMSEYDGTAVANVKKLLADVNNNQPGNIQLGAKVIVDVLTKEGGKEIPVRLVLGSDAYSQIKQKCEDTVDLLKQWETVSCSTDFPKGQ